MDSSASSLVCVTLSGAEALVAQVGGTGLQSARERLDLSRAALAARLSITRQSIHHYETGLRRPKGLIALKLVEALDLTT